MEGGVAAKVNPAYILLLSLYGLTMVWSPVFGTSEAMVFDALAPYQDEMVFSRICSLLGFGLSMAVFSFIGESATRWASLPCFGWTFAALGSVGMLLGSFVGIGLLPLEFLYPGAFLRGLFATGNAMLWMPLFMRLDWRVMGASMAAALMVYALVGILIVTMSGTAPAVSTALLVACPPISQAACESIRIPRDEGDSSRRVAESAPFETRLMLYAANLLFGVLLGAIVYHFSVFNTTIAMLTFFGAATLMLIVIILLPQGLGLHFVYRANLLLVAAAIPLAILSGWMGFALATAASSAILAVVIFCSVVIYSDTQARFSRPFWRVPGRCQAFAAAGMAASFVAFHAFRPEVVSASDVMLIAVSCMMFIAGVFSPSARSGVRPWGFSSLVPTEPAEIKRLRRCGEVADEFGLTSRELEVLQQLAMGSVKNEIAEALVISPATAKTHVRNIYAKLGIHSQKELQQLIEE